MSSNFRDVDRDTLYLLPPSLQEWLPEGHLARFVVEMVEELDLRELEEGYRGSGKAAYHPTVLLSMLFYGYATGVFSSRRLEQASYDSVAFRFITGNTHPDHDTIAHFRKRFVKEVEGMFVQLLVLAKETGVLKLGHVSLDGTKVKANASKHKAMSWGYANGLEAQLQEEVRALLKKAAEADAEEEGQVDIPAELVRREDRLAMIGRAKARIEQRAKERFAVEQAEYEEKVKRRQEKAEKSGKKPGGRHPRAPAAGPQDKDQVNFTDEESRIMPSTEGFVQGYNAQAAVDIDSHLIVENHLTQQTNDKQQIKPAVAGLKKTQGQLGKPAGLLADAGYFSGDNVDFCEGEEITPYISDHREPHHVPLAERQPPPASDTQPADAVTAMAHRLRTPEGRALYARRKSTVETVFGIVKEVMGFRRFHLRGFQAAQGEWNLVCMAWNLKRMHALSG